MDIAFLIDLSDDIAGLQAEALVSRISLAGAISSNEEFFGFSLANFVEDLLGCIGAVKNEKEDGSG